MRVALLLVLLLVLPASAAAEAGEVIVRYRAGVDASERAGVRRDADVARRGAVALARAELVAPPAGASPAEAAALLERSRDVLYAEPDLPRRAFAVPSDPGFSLQWGLRNTGQLVDGTSGQAGADIGATTAWDTTTGAPGIIVAVADTGLDAGHPDLEPGVWTNPGEAAGQAGVDDDGNGLIDDLHGWDFTGPGDAEPDDEGGHGTHVAGTIGARGNDGTGVAGVAWSTTLLPLRILDAQGDGTVSDEIAAYAYAVRAGARVVNLSLGGDAPSQAEREAMAAASGVLFVTAAGNDGADTAQVGSYPCNYDLANVVCVAASDRYDRLAGFSNFGAQAVELAAPGETILSTWVRTQRSYDYNSGTSMAAPHVAGAAALALARVPSAAPSELRRALVASAAPTPGLAGTSVSGGRLDARRLLDEVQPPPTATPSPVAVVSPPAAPAPPAVRPVDRTAPAVTVPRRSDLATALRRRRPIALRCSEACRVEVSLLHGGRRVGRASASLRPGVARRVRLRLTARGRRVQRARSARLVVRVAARDAAGNERTVDVRLTVRR